MKKLISRCLLITCCAIIAVGLLSSVSFAEAPSVMIKTVSPRITTTTDRYMKFEASIIGDNISASSLGNDLELDGVPVLYSMTDSIPAYVLYVPEEELSLGPHTYTWRFSYGGGHQVTQTSSFIVGDYYHGNSGSGGSGSGDGKGNPMPYYEMPLPTR